MMDHLYISCNIIVYFLLVFLHYYFAGYVCDLVMFAWVLGFDGVPWCMFYLCWILCEFRGGVVTP